MEIRDLTTLEEFRRVVELEKSIWGYTDAEDVVPVPIFVVTVKRGAVLLGAFDERGEMAGFVYSLPGIRHARPIQWSHMLGVVPEHRSSGLGLELKLAQRERTLAQRLDLIEWTFDPLQTLNAHFNFTKLGVIVEEYEPNAYGESSSHLHRGAPTDRFVAEWWIRERRVEERVAMVRNGRHFRPTVPEDALPLNVLYFDGTWHRSVVQRLAPGDERPVVVAIPPDFTRMLAEAPDMAHHWRMDTRELFTDAFRRGYQVRDFVVDAETGGGRYVLVKS